MDSAADSLFVDSLGIVRSVQYGRAASIGRGRFQQPVETGRLYGGRRLEQLAEVRVGWMVVGSQQLGVLGRWVTHHNSWVVSGGRVPATASPSTVAGGRLVGGCLSS